MSHRPNYAMTDYSKIWKDVSPVIQSADFSFANIEAPVDSALPYSSYPDFNMKTHYPKAAVKAGFNVFSIINNHTNDQGLDGMKATLAWSEEMEKEYENSDRPLCFCGINAVKGSPVSFRIIQKNGWKIIFCAVTEILNRPSYTSYMNFVSPGKKSREAFCAYVKKIRGENPCDLFILSIHCSDEEYKKSVPESQRRYYKQLLENGVDIVWANHPHVIKERELIGNKADGKLHKLIMYANGNTVSGQRWQPALDNAFNAREDTGDGLMLGVIVEKDMKNGGIEITSVTPYYITTYINTSFEFVVKYLDDAFISYLKNADRAKWAAYIEQRKKISEKTKEITTWQ